MAKIVKLENLVITGYNPLSGGADLKETTEYVCEACRYLADKDDKFCGHCGEELEPSTSTEHYSEGKKLTNKQFKEELEQYGG